MNNIEKRLERIERKLFPENIKTLYCFKQKCSNENCHEHYTNINVIGYPKYPNADDLDKCKYCGKDIFISDIQSYEEVVFED